LVNPFLGWKCLDCFNWNKYFFGVQSVGTVGRYTTTFLLAGQVCLWRLVYLLFCYLTHETQTINSGGLLIANHLPQSLWVNQKGWPILRSYLVYPFAGVLLATATCTSMMSQTIFMTQAGIDIMTFLHPIYCANHILSTSGDALTHWTTKLAHKK
jgi:hypothetical protein